MYESANIMGYCACWMVGEWFVYILILKVCVDFCEVVSCVHNASTFIAWFDYNGLVIFEVVKCFLFFALYLRRSLLSLLSACQREYLSS